MSAADDHVRRAAHDLRAAADLFDAIDPRCPKNKRELLIIRMLETNPDAALALAVMLLYGLLEEFDRTDPHASQKALRIMRTRVAEAM